MGTCMIVRTDSPTARPGADCGGGCAMGPAAPGGKIHRVDPDFGSTLKVSNRDYQSNCWVNLRMLGQPCEFQVLDRGLVWQHLRSWVVDFTRELQPSRL
jgi:hypothetical protein